jgi:hypothetical protein
MFKEAGYDSVGSAEVGDDRAAVASNVGSSVTRKDVGGGQHAVLMEIPNEYYKEDQAAKEHGLKNLERSLIPEELKKDAYGDGMTISSSLEGKSSSPRVVIQ